MGRGHRYVRHGRHLASDQPRQGHGGREGAGGRHEVSSVEDGDRPLELEPGRQALELLRRVDGCRRRRPGRPRRRRSRAPRLVEARIASRLPVSCSGHLGHLYRPLCGRGSCSWAIVLRIIWMRSLDWLTSAPFSSKSALRSSSASRSAPSSAAAKTSLDTLGDELLRLGDERLDHLVLRHDADDLALDEQVTLVASGRNAEVGLARLAGAVDDASHDGDLKRDAADSKASWARLATSMTSISARPHDGQAMRSRPLRSRSPSASSSWRPARASLTGSAVSEYRMRVADTFGEEGRDARRCP